MSLVGQVWTLQKFRIPPDQLMALKTANLNQVSILFVNCEQKCNKDWILLHDVPKEHEIEEQEDEESELEFLTQPCMARKKSDATLLNQAAYPSAETAAIISPVANPRHISKPPPPSRFKAKIACLFLGFPSV